MCNSVCLIYKTRLLYVRETNSNKLIRRDRQEVKKQHDEEDLTEGRMMEFLFYLNCTIKIFSYILLI